MTESALEKCPRCGEALQAGFAHRAIGLSFVSPEKLEKFVSLDEDIAQSGLRKLLPCVGPPPRDAGRYPSYAKINHTNSDLPIRL